MIAKHVVAKKEQKLSQLILDNCPWMNYNSAFKIIRQKDAKINGTRVKDDKLVSVGDEIEFYYKQEFKIQEVFEDENILIVNKPKRLEITHELEDNINLKTAKKIEKDDNLNSKLRKDENFELSLQDILEQYKGKIYPVHRLDRNTDGLVIFAKNKEAKISLDQAFKNRTLSKYYLALIFGTFKNTSDELVAYLKKDSDKSVVDISDDPKSGYSRIETRYKVLESTQNYSLLEIELVTGKTHQIRAHLAHVGHFVLGDNKYGDSRINRNLKLNYQCLSAYKIILNFKDDKLSYLNGKIIELEDKKNSMLKQLQNL